MSDEDKSPPNKLISLDEHRQKRIHAENTSRNKADTAKSQTVIPFTKSTAKSQKAGIPDTAKMVWLKCPKCKTIEYTHLIAPSGRRHKCGAIVLEQEMEINITREYTICLINLHTLQELSTELNLLLTKPAGDTPANTGQSSEAESDEETPVEKKTTVNFTELALMQQMIRRRSEQISVFIDRLKQAAGRSELTSMTESEIGADRYINTAPLDKFKLIISEFNLSPERHFPSV